MASEAGKVIEAIKKTSNEVSKKTDLYFSSSPIVFSFNVAPRPLAPSPNRLVNISGMNKKEQESTFQVEFYVQSPLCIIKEENDECGESSEKLLIKSG